MQFQSGLTKQTSLFRNNSASFMIDKIDTERTKVAPLPLLAEMVPCRWMCNPVRPAAHRQALSPWESCEKHQKLHNSSSNTRHAIDAASDSSFIHCWSNSDKIIGAFFWASTSRGRNHRLFFTWASLVKHKAPQEELYAFYFTFSSVNSSN